MPSVINDYLNQANGGAPAPAPAKVAKPQRQAPVVTEQIRQDRDSMRGLLHNGIWTVEFTKVDGTPTTMECTLDSRFIPDAATTSAAGAQRQAQEHLLHVYAVDRAGWRSFLVANVNKFYRKVES